MKDIWNFFSVRMEVFQKKKLKTSHRPAGRSPHQPLPPSSHISSPSQPSLSPMFPHLSMPCPPHPPNPLRFGTIPLPPTAPPVPTGASASARAAFPPETALPLGSQALPALLPGPLTHGASPTSALTAVKVDHYQVFSHCHK